VEINKIYNEDCLEGMNRIPDKSIDMILCDLPYGTTSNKWDTPIDLNLLWKQYKRIIKEKGAIVLTSQQPFTTTLINSNPKGFKHEWIWEKTRVTGFLNAKRRPLTAHENVIIFCDGTPIYNPQKWKIDERFMDKRNKFSIESYNQSNYGNHTKKEHIKDDGTRYPQSIIPVSSVNNTKNGHPTRKPVQLFEYLIKTYTNEGETVLDNCMGSGTTAIAAINTNRNYIGFELDKGYYDLACTRLEEHIQNRNEVI
jgi:site-specific DNA-methyltransferase (adenine-specific)